MDRIVDSTKNKSNWINQENKTMISKSLHQQPADNYNNYYLLYQLYGTIFFIVECSIVLN